METLPGTRKSPENSSTARKVISGLLAMAPFFLACEKDADTTPSATNTSPSLPSVTASTTPTQSAKPAITSKPIETSKPVEKVEESHVTLKGNPSNIGPTLFMGDSLTAKIGEFGGKFNIENTVVVTKVGQKTTWLLRQAKELARDGKLGRFENAVVLIGSNDMGDGGPGFTAPKIFGRIEKIYSTLYGDLNYDGKPDINGVDRVYGVTLPPFKGENNLSKEGVFNEVNTRRLEINELIKGSKLPFRVIDIAATLDKGGIADNNDPDRISLIGPNNETYRIRDGMHCPKIYLRLIYERELSKAAY